MKRTVKNSLKVFCCILFLIFNILTFTACFGKITGPYHYSSVITVPNKVVSVEGRNYCILEGHVYELVDGSLKRVSTSSGNDESYVGGASDIQTDGKYLYISHNGVSKFMSDYQYVGKITKETGCISSFLLSGENIYYVKDTDEKGIVEQLNIYNINTEEHKIIADNVINQVIDTDDGSIYVNKRRRLFWTSEVDGANLFGSSFCSRFTNNKLSSLGFYNQGTTGEISAEENGIKISYSNEVYEYLTDKSVCLYGRLLVKDNKLIFSAYEVLENNECINNFCICHIGVSNLIQFDFETKKFETVKTLKQGEYFISFDDSGCSYYSDGEIVDRTLEKISVNKVEPFGQFKVQGGDSKNGTCANQSVICEFGNEIYYLFRDYEQYLKDLYW